MDADEKSKKITELSAQKTNILRQIKNKMKLMRIATKKNRLALTKQLGQLRKLLTLTDSEIISLS